MIFFRFKGIEIFWGAIMDLKKIHLSSLIGLKVCSFKNGF